MRQWVYLGATVVAFAVYSFYVARKNARALAIQRGIFQARAPQNVENWFSTNFAESGLPCDQLVQLLQPVADAMHCHVSQLHPDDSFTGTLAFHGVTYLGIADDDPLGDYAERDLVRILKTKQRAALVMEQITSNPTLQALARAVAEVNASAAAR